MSQVSFSYGVATKGERQAHLHLLGARGFVKQQLRAQMTHLDSWALTLEDAGYADHFKARSLLCCSTWPRHVGVCSSLLVPAALAGVLVMNIHGCVLRACWVLAPSSMSSPQPPPQQPQEQLGDVVYLTADSPNELETIDTGKAGPRRPDNALPQPPRPLARSLAG